MGFLPRCLGSQPGPDHPTWLFSCRTKAWKSRACVTHLHGNRVSELNIGPRGLRNSFWGDLGLSCLNSGPLWEVLAESGLSIQFSLRLPMALDVARFSPALGVHGQVTAVGPQEADCGMEMCMQEADWGGLSGATPVRMREAGLDRGRS